MRRVLLAIVSTTTGLVLLLSFKSHGAASTAAPAAAVSGSTSGTSAEPSPSSTAGTSTPTPTSTKKATSSTTVTGEAADTRYGPVQVRITVKDGTITSATAVEYPDNDPRDEQINAFAIPELNAEAEKAGNADIDLISGATFTSQGYLESLQSALDKAKS